MSQEIRESHELTEVGTEAVELDNVPLQPETKHGPPIIAYFQIALLSIGIVTSFVFFVLFFSAENYHGGTAALVSGVVGSCVLHILILDIRKRLEEWYDVKILSNIQLFALLIALTSLVAMGVYLYLGIAGPLEKNRNSFYPPIIFIFLVIVWTSLLFWLIKQHLVINKKEEEKC